VVVAAICFCGPLISSRLMSPGIDFDAAARASLILSAIWLLLFIVALIRYRIGGLWLLIGAPFALFYPLAFLLVWWV
jgi:hypothetical protein